MAPLVPLAANKPTRACVTQAAEEAERKKREQELEKQKAKEWADQEPLRQQQREVARLAQEQARDENQRRLEDEKRVEKERKLAQKAREKQERLASHCATLDEAEVALVKAIRSVSPDALKPSHISMLVNVVQPGATAAKAALKILERLPAAKMDEALNAGAITNLMAMMSGDEKMGVLAASCFAACATRPQEDGMISFLPTACATAHSLGAASLLIRLLKTTVDAEGGKDENAIQKVVWAIFVLCWGCPDSCAAVHSAGGISLLTSLLCRAEIGISAFHTVPRVLEVICKAQRNLLSDTVLNTLPETIWSVELPLETEKVFDDLLKRLVPAALRKIDLATGDATDLAALQLVDHLGEAAGLSQERLRAVRANLAAFKRRRELGLEKMQLPNEFICPITQEKMKGWSRTRTDEPALIHQSCRPIACRPRVLADPVVASDGHSYERTAIEQIIKQAPRMRVSPLTRDPLQQNLFPNVNLRKRIAEHDSDLLCAAEASRAAMRSSGTAA